jgi:carbon-monoxide dehydrogenase small subunit
MEKRIEFILNGKKTECIVPCNMTLLDMLRTKFRMISVKKGCDSGDCGSCTVIVNNEPICSCLMLAVQADGKDVLTLEGVTSGGNCIRCSERSWKTMGCSADSVHLGL